MDHAPHQPLLATADAALAEELTRLSAAAGAAVEVVSTGAEVLGGVEHRAGRARRRRPRAGAGRAGAAAQARRPGRRVVTGADRVVPRRAARRRRAGRRAARRRRAGSPSCSPTSRRWAAATGVLLGVVGGSGGAGATTLACGLGQVAADRGPTLVVDLDPLGPGCDRVLALDEAPGVRWDSLGTASGRLSGRSLREAVPRRNGLGVLGWASAPSALDAARGPRGSVGGSPRPRHGGGRPPACGRPRGRDGRAVRDGRAGRGADGHRCGRRGQVGGRARPTRAGSRLLVRGRGADPRRVAALVGAPVLAMMADQRGLAEALDLGLGPVRSRRGPLAAAARELLAGLTPAALAA